MTALAGIGPMRAAALAKLGLRDQLDLLLLLPVRLEQGCAPSSIAEAQERLGQQVRVRGVIERASLQRFGSRSTLRLSIRDASGSLAVLFFNQPWLKRDLHVGLELELYGRMVDARGPALVSPKIGTASKPLVGAGELVPIYPKVEGLSQARIASLCRELSRRCAADFAESLPPDVLVAHALCALPDALRAVHAPPSPEEFERARRRLAFEHLLALTAQLEERRRAAAGANALCVQLDPAMRAELLRHFPFVFTAAQARVALELEHDLARAQPMRRLLQGDVGSGKTALAALAMLSVARAGGQSAFLAPTELLAEQHAAGLAPLFAAANVRAALLTGSTTAAERRVLLRELESGALQIVFGTHALFAPNVRYRRLALCVIDEQHRFGVAQRSELIEKGSDAHALLLTATPIPRTLAQVLYGHLERSVLDEKPPGRGALHTRWERGAKKRALEGFLLERVARGERLYWVVPRIFGDDQDGQPESAKAASAEDRHARLLRSPLAAFGIELVHGRQPAAERQARLERFRRGEVRCLVATTVIEVGVDVPEASLMVIEGAERLGLAQLHQLRGRIGRGPRESWCLLFGKPVARARFELLERTQDGFVLAEHDLAQRGMGDLAGMRQAGLNSEGLADLEGGLELFELAARLCREEESVFARYRPNAARGLRFGAL